MGITGALHPLVPALLTKLRQNAKALDNLAYVSPLPVTRLKSID